MTEQTPLEKAYDELHGESLAGKLEAVSKAWRKLLEEVLTAAGFATAKMKAEIRDKAIDETLEALGKKSVRPHDECAVQIVEYYQRARARIEALKGEKPYGFSKHTLTARARRSVTTNTKWR